MQHHIALCLALVGCGIDDPDELDTDSVSQEVNYATYTTCASAGVYPSRLCLDWTTGYGPVIQVYTNNKVAYSFGVDASRTAPEYRVSWVDHPVEWRHISGTMTAARHPNGGDFITVSGPNDRPNGIGVLNPANHDIVEWFSAAPNYVFMTAY
jgi:hypothetical protein